MPAADLTVGPPGAPVPAVAARPAAARGAVVVLQEASATLRRATDSTATSGPPSSRRPRPMRGSARSPS